MLFVLIYCHVYIKLKWEVKKKNFFKKDKNQIRKEGKDKTHVKSTQPNGP